MARQLTFQQRSVIEEMLRRQTNLAAIAREIGVHRSTVKREIERNGSMENYCAEQAHIHTLCRKQLAAHKNHLLNIPPQSATGKKKDEGNRRIRANTHYRIKYFWLSPKLRTDLRIHRKLDPYRTELYHSWKKVYDQYSRVRNHWNEERARGAWYRDRSYRYRHDPIWVDRYSSPAPRLVWSWRREFIKQRLAEFPIKVKVLPILEAKHEHKKEEKTALKALPFLLSIYKMPAAVCFSHQKYFYFPDPGQKNHSPPVNGERVFYAKLFFSRHFLAEKEFFSFFNPFF